MFKQTAIFLITLAIIAANYPVEAQQPGKVPVIGFLLGSSKKVHGAHVDRLRQGLKEEGYVDGRDIVLEYRFAGGNRKIARDLAAEFVRRRVDLIVTVGIPSTRFAAKATKTIPIVVAYASNLLGSGLVASMAKPGGNVTGITVLTEELAAKRLELSTEAVPGISRVALIFGPNKSALKAVTQTRLAAEKFGVTLQEVPVRSPADFADAFAAMAGQRAGALILVAGRVVSKNRRQIFELAGKRRIPTICWRPAMVRDGCLIGYGADRGRMVRQAARYVANILRGANPGDLPVQRSTRLELVVNLKTAKALGFTFPPLILLRATEVIE